MGHALGWVFDYGLEQGLEMAHQSFNGGTFEKIGVVFSRSLQGTLSFGNRKSQVKDRGSFFDVNWSRYQIRQLQLRERRILEQRFGLVDGYSRTVEEVERQFRVTRERLRQLEKRALSKMRHLGPAEIIEHINEGLPFRELEHVRSQIDEPLESLARLLSISRSTLQRRRAEKKLSPPESDRLMRFCQIMRHAARVFGSLERARAWLKHPQRGLDGAIPLDYASTEVGAREVENLLGRIDYGVYS